MSEPEKKVKVDELPDEGSEPVLKNQPKVISRPTEPRIEKIKSLTGSERLALMDQSWSFDSQELSFNWFPFVTALVLAEVSGFFKTVKEEILSMKNMQETLGPDVFLPILEIGAEFIAHPLIFLFMVPVFFKFRVPSEYRFNVKFDGIDTRKKYLPWGSKEILSSVFVRWDEISEVRKVKINGKEVLQLFSPVGHIADLIWYINKKQKRALKLLLGGIISPSHPLRVFLDKEKEIM